MNSLLPRLGNFQWDVTCDVNTVVPVVKCFGKENIHRKSF